jgi:hypothetical protein
MDFGLAGLIAAAYADVVVGAPGERSGPNFRLLYVDDFVRAGLSKIRAEAKCREGKQHEGTLHCVFS